MIFSDRTFSESKIKRNREGHRDGTLGHPGRRLRCIAAEDRRTVGRTERNWRTAEEEMFCTLRSKGESNYQRRYASGIPCDRSMCAAADQHFTLRYEIFPLGCIDIFWDPAEPGSLLRFQRSAIGAQLKKRCSVLCGAKERSM